MQKVALFAARTIGGQELTRGLVEIGDRRELCINRLAVEPPIVQLLARLFRVFLVAKLDIGVADQVLVQIVAHVQLFQLAVLLLHFDKELFVHFVKVALQVLFGVLLALQQRLFGVERPEVEVLDQNCLYESGTIVLLGALETL